jgi:hypothetical protein
MIELHRTKSIIAVQENCAIDRLVKFVLFLTEFSNCVSDSLPMLEGWIEARSLNFGLPYAADFVDLATASSDLRFPKPLQYISPCIVQWRFIPKFRHFWLSAKHSIPPFPTLYREVRWEIGWGNDRV